MAQPRVKVLFDTDIGSDIDDALALAYLLCQPRCDLLGVTTVTAEPVKRAQMASAICRHAGRGDVPIHSGCPDGLLAPILLKSAAQAKALQGWDYQADFPENTAVEFMRRTLRAHPGEVTLLAVGPMTNVGLLFATDPQVPALLKQLVLMCGVFFRAGGEWNAINDPAATAITYGHGPQARPARHVSYGLDVTTQCKMARDECRQRFTAKALEPVRGFAEVWFERAEQVVFHDPLAAACIFEPDLCTYKQGTVRVSLHEPTKGWTTFSQGGDAKPHTVAHQVDSAAFLEHYFSIVK